MSDQTPISAESHGADARAFEGHVTGFRPESHVAPLRAAAESAAALRPRRFWLVEIWEEHRDAFKALFADILLFGLILAVLAVSHFVIERLHYPPERKDLIEKLHFYGYVTILAVFIFGLILKVITHEYRGLRK